MIAALGVRLLVAAVFLVAGGAKLADPLGTHRALGEFGVPARLRGVVGVGLPVAELVVGIGVVPSGSARWAALGALGLLLAFLIVVGLSLARGRHPECRCFGRVRAKEVGWSTMARNAVLAVFAGITLWKPDRLPIGGAGWLHGLRAVDWAALMLGGAAVLVAAAAGWAAVKSMAQQGRLLVRVEALEAALHGPAVHTGAAHRFGSLPVGSPAPDFRLPSESGEMVSRDDLLAAGLPIVMVFSDPACDSCRELLPEVGQWSAAHQTEAVVAVVSRRGRHADPHRDRDLVDGSVGIRVLHGIRVLQDNGQQVGEAFGSPATPSAIIMGADGLIASPSVAGPAAVTELLATWFGRHQAASAEHPGPENGHERLAPGNGLPERPAPGQRALHLGDVAPRLVLDDLDGGVVDTAEWLDRTTLLVFWSPACGYCRLLLPWLLAWERHRPRGAPRLLVVASGSADENRNDGLSLPRVLDPDGAAMRCFGAMGTPSGVLIDAHGRMASAVVAGSEAILALAYGRPGLVRSRPSAAAADLVAGKSVSIGNS